MTAKTEGVAALKKKLNDLPKAAQMLIRQAMAQGAEDIVALARARVPIDSGDLRESINWKWGNAPTGARILAQAGTGENRLTIFAGNDEAFYARWVEFGTKAHDVNKGGGTKAYERTGAVGTRHPGAKADPFFYPAFRALRPRAKRRITRAVNKAIKQVGAK